MNKLDFLMGKLNFMSKALGGSGVNQVQEKMTKQKEFEFLVKELKEQTDRGRQLLDEWARIIASSGKDCEDRIKLDHHIREIIKNGRLKYDKCRELLRKTKKSNKFSASQLTTRQNGLDGLLKNINILEKQFKNSSTASRRQGVMHDGGDSNQDLFASNQPYGDNKFDDIEVRDGQLQDYEKDALNQFKQNDMQIDKLLQQIGEGLDDLNQQAGDIGQKISSNSKKAQHLNQKVQKSNQTLRLQVNDLKKILNKYRSSSKICIDILLILVLVALLGVLYNVIKSK